MPCSASSTSIPRLPRGLVPRIRLTQPTSRTILRLGPLGTRAGCNARLPAGNLITTALNTSGEAAPRSAGRPRGAALTMSRRAIAASLLLLGQGAAPAIAADEEAISDEETRRAIMLASNVVPALSVEQYKAAISRARADAWPQIRGDIEEENFDQLSNSLLFGSFDEVKQSSFYLPWALLEKDVGAAVRARDAYMRLSDAIDNFSTAAAEGAKLNFSTEQVRSAFDDVDSALDVFLSASASA
mmetsp:Transcript_39767/g.99981  ORF Transcript_39767/g.99981 Transcript_39767/m.99981 type:complete len:243 (+) Transcript_39767:237-965(+)